MIEVRHGKDAKRRVYIHGDSNSQNLKISSEFSSGADDKPSLNSTAHGRSTAHSSQAIEQLTDCESQPP